LLISRSNLQFLAPALAVRSSYFSATHRYAMHIQISMHQFSNNFVVGTKVE